MTIFNTFEEKIYRKFEFACMCKTQYSALLQYLVVSIKFVDLKADFFHYNLNIIYVYYTLTFLIFFFYYKMKSSRLTQAIISIQRGFDHITLESTLVFAVDYSLYWGLINLLNSQYYFKILFLDEKWNLLLVYIAICYSRSL